MKHAHGFLELDRKLAALERLPERPEVQAALLAGAAVIRDEERRLVSVRTGELRDGIVISSRPVNLPREANTVYVAPYAMYFYAAFLEFGTSTRAPQAFVRPAVDARGEEALTVISTHLQRAVRATIA